MKHRVEIALVSFVAVSTAACEDVVVLHSVVDRNTIALNEDENDGATTADGMHLVLAWPGSGAVIHEGEDPLFVERDLALSGSLPQSVRIDGVGPPPPGTFDEEDGMKLPAAFGMFVALPDGVELPEDIFALGELPLADDVIIGASTMALVYVDDLLTTQLFLPGAGPGFNLVRMSGFERQSCSAQASVRREECRIAHEDECQRVEDGAVLENVACVEQRCGTSDDIVAECGPQTMELVPFDSEIRLDLFTLGEWRALFPAWPEDPQNYAP